MSQRFGHPPGTTTKYTFIGAPRAKKAHYAAHKSALSGTRKPRILDKDFFNSPDPPTNPTAALSGQDFTLQTLLAGAERGNVIGHLMKTSVDDLVVHTKHEHVVEVILQQTPQIRTGLAINVTDP